MKKSNFRIFLFSTIILAGIVAVSVYSCEKEAIIPNASMKNTTTEDGFVTEPGAVCGTIQEKSIINSDNRSVGKALVYNDTKFFYVILNTNQGYNFTNAYMHIGDKFNDFPLDVDGLAILESYEYAITDQPMNSMRKFRIPLTEMSGAAHVSVATTIASVDDDTKTGTPIVVWVEGKYFGKDKTGRSFTFNKTTCMTTEGETVSE